MMSAVLGFHWVRDTLEWLPRVTVLTRCNGGGRAAGEQIQAMHRQMEDATYNHEKEMSTVAYKYAQLEGQVRAYHAQLLAEMAPDLTAQQPQPV
jgi:hypothetical protein